MPKLYSQISRAILRNESEAETSAKHKYRPTKPAGKNASKSGTRSQKHYLSSEFINLDSVYSQKITETIILSQMIID